MPPVIIPQTMRQVVSWESGAVNVFHIRPLVAGPYTIAQLDDASEEFQTAFAATLLTIVSSDGAIDEFRTKDISIANGQEFVASSAGVGGVAGADSALNVAMVVTWRTALNGRRGRGRTFLPHIPATYIDATARKFTAAAVTAVTQEALDFRTHAAFVDYPPAVASMADAVSRVISGHSVNNNIDTMRGRVRPAA